MLWHIYHIKPHILKAIDLELIEHPGDILVSTIYLRLNIS